MTIRRVEWAVGAADTGDAETLTITLSDDNLVRLFGGAKRVLGGEPAIAYWQARLAADPTARDTARLEAVALATRNDVVETLNETAHARIESLFETHGPAIEALTSGRRSTYERLRGQASAPSLAPIHLPEVAEFTAGGEAWERHLFAAADSTASLPLNSVEADVVREELANPEVHDHRRDPGERRSYKQMLWMSTSDMEAAYPPGVTISKRRREPAGGVRRCSG